MSNTTHTDRIKQMAQEAGIFNDARNLEHMPTLVESLEVFAQLVAEDCAQHVERNLTAGRSPMGKVASATIRARYTNEG